MILMAALLPTVLQDPGPGISRELARARKARVSQVRYELQFALEPAMTAVAGSVTLRFALTDADAPLVLDFAGTELADVRLQDQPAGNAVRQVHDHLVLPKSLLRKGENTVHATFRSPVAATGTPLTVYKDPADGAEYYYTLLVPSDAHRLFPCFDQPDLKGSFTLTLTAPTGWGTVANTDVDSSDMAGTPPRATTRFLPSKELSTYLFAFAAGPFGILKTFGPPPEGVQGVQSAPRIFVRTSKVDALEQDKVRQMHLGALRFLEGWFGCPYPFGKLDVVLLPGFPYGGMEHAGAIFYRESALVFDHAPTEVELLRRSTLVYHEVSHQWFGNLVTMEWFDDLWLKEGFATFVGYLALAELEPDRQAWLRFHQSVKPPALRVDVTEGTTPIFQELRNLDDAKSNYGPIVYNKAPAMLRELEARLSPAVFRDGVRAFLKQHAFGNARWQDLLAAFESAAKSKLTRWSERWILGRGMPRVRVQWGADGGKLGKVVLTQESCQGGKDTWPLRLELLLGKTDGTGRKVAVTFDEPRHEIAELAGSEAPAWILPNAGDTAYGQFLLDRASAAALLETLPAIPDAATRQFALSALFETLREAELDPVAFGELCIRLLQTERDPIAHHRLLGCFTTTVQRYLHPGAAHPLVFSAAAVLRDQLRKGELGGCSLEALRALVRLRMDAPTRVLCQEIAGGKVPGLTLGPEDRFLLLAAELAVGVKDADTRIAALAKETKSQDVRKHEWLARAATPDAAGKERYFQAFLDPKDPPEQWVTESLSFFHWPGHEPLTLPFLARALQQVEWVKQHRKIFFMPAWLDGFINGHQSPEALAVVEGFLAQRKDLPADIRLKVLQSVDGLRRAVRIRKTQ